MLTIKEFAEIFGVAERTVREYCMHGKIAGAVKKGGTWLIPEGATCPKSTRNAIKNALIDRLTAELTAGISGGIYHKTQIALAYNSNHIEGSTLTEEQTRLIFETRTVGEGHGIKVDDIIETNNHFRCFDEMLKGIAEPLTQNIIKTMHKILKTGTHDSGLEWFRVGEYKALPNEVGGKPTSPPELVEEKMQELLSAYHKSTPTFEDIVRFHHDFEAIHPFQDGNGRVGRLIMFRECLRHNIVPFIIEDRNKFYYYRGLAEWEQEPGYLLDTCRSAQDNYRAWLAYFKIKSR